MDRPIRVATSPDGLLTLELYGDDFSLGFQGNDWHTHGDLLIPAYGATPQTAASAFFDSILDDQQIICISPDTFVAWITTDIELELAIAGDNPPALRVWSGKQLQLGPNNSFKPKPLRGSA